MEEEEDEEEEREEDEKDWRFLLPLSLPLLRLLAVRLLKMDPGSKVEICQCMYV